MTDAAGEHVGVAHDGGTVIVIGYAGVAVVGEVVGGEGGPVVDQLHIPPDIGDFCAPVVVQRVAVDIEGVAHVDVYPAESTEIV